MAEGPRPRQALLDGPGLPAREPTLRAGRWSGASRRRRPAAARSLPMDPGSTLAVRDRHAAEVERAGIKTLSELSYGAGRGDVWRSRLGEAMILAKPSERGDDIGEAVLTRRTVPHLPPSGT